LDTANIYLPFFLIWSNGKKVRIKSHNFELHSGVKIITLFLMAKQSLSVIKATNLKLLSIDSIIKITIHRILGN